MKNGRNIKILSVSDVVEPTIKDLADTDLFTGVNLILSCGDLPPEYLSRLVHLINAPLYYVHGNHDVRFQQTQPVGAGNLHGRLIKIEGVNILGLEGSRWYNGGPFQYTESEMRSIIRQLRPTIWWRGGVDIIATHAPPRHIHDAEDLCHMGFECFRWLIDKYRPSYFIHGHIHKHFSDPAERVTMVNSTKVVNTYGFCILEIEGSPEN